MPLRIQSTDTAKFVNLFHEEFDRWPKYGGECDGGWLSNESDEDAAFFLLKFSIELPSLKLVKFGSENCA